MNEKMFAELLESVEQAGAIIRGEMKPSRVFEYSEAEVKAIREKTEAYIAQPQALYPKIKSASAIDNHTLLVEFSNAEMRKYDITKLLAKEMFFPLKNPCFFKNFTIDSSGCGIVWNEEIDISEYEIWAHGAVLNH